MNKRPDSRIIPAVAVAHSAASPRSRGGCVSDGAKVDCGLRVVVSYQQDDPAWDDFLAQTQGGHHAQSSLWSQVKELMGYRAVRVLVLRHGRVVAGAQMLVRRVAWLGNVAYVPKGPLVADDDPEVTRLLLREMQHVAKSDQMRIFIVQPPDHDRELARRMPGFGFPASPVAIGPTATCVLDLTREVDDILATMKTRTRYNIRLASRKGIVVREGSENDLSEFYRTLVATGGRQQFSVYPEGYYRGMWRIFSQRDAIRLALAEYRGEVVSGQLAICFGDTVTNKMSAWSGRWAKCRPNELLQWSTIEWAKSLGFRRYDFDGIKTEAAEAVLRGESLPDRFKQTVTSFKLGFGSQPVLVPGAYDFVYSLPLRWAYRRIIAKIARSQRVRDTVYRLRTRRTEE